MNAVTNPQNFEQRVFERMRANIGELMTDDELKRLLNTTVERMFFTAKVADTGYYRETRTEPPEIYKIVRELVEPKVRDAIKAYLEDHSAEVRKAIDEALAGGLVAAYTRALSELMAAPMQSLQNQLFTLTQDLQLKGVVR